MELKHLQNLFTQYMMNPDKRPPDALTKTMAGKRLRLYRQLVQNTVAGGLDSGFPYTRKALGTQGWTDIKFSYWQSHPPQRWELNSTADDFPHWLTQVYLPEHPKAPKYAGELADYERLELTVYLHPDKDWTGNPSLNPTLALRTYQYDIATWVKNTEGELGGHPKQVLTQTAIYRDPSTLLCRFLNLNPLTMALLTHLQGGESLREFIAQVSNAMQIDPLLCQKQVAQLMKTLENKGLVQRTAE